jgi:hypothetical protein
MTKIKVDKWLFRIMIFLFTLIFVCPFFLSKDVCDVIENIFCGYVFVCVIANCVKTGLELDLTDRKR